MSDIQSAVVATLQTSTDLIAVTGTSRIFCDALPQANGQLAAVRVSDISGQPDHALTGIAESIEHRIQIDCYSQTRTQATTLRDYVRDLFDQYKGLMSGVRVHSCMEGGRRGWYEPPIDGSDYGRYVRSIDLLIVTAEST